MTPPPPLWHPFGMFVPFVYALRQRKVPVGTQEALSLAAALGLGLHDSSLEGFYQVARALLIHDEKHLDDFDLAFAEYFKGVAFEAKKVTDEILDWLREVKAMRELTDEEKAMVEALDPEALQKLFEERLKEQKGRHDGGNRWIGTGGTSPFGNGGRNPAGIRVGGAGGGRQAVQVAEARRYRDYRNDRVLDTRQIAVALRKLRRLARKEGEPELDIDDTIDRTGKNAGELELAFIPPRENQARVMLAMDVGGSMTPYTRMVETLFSAASAQNHWKKLESFYFHNCPYSRLFTSMTSGDNIPTAEVLKTRPPETFMLLVGDASMAPSELISANGAIDWFERSETAGLVWLHRLRTTYTRSVWLNPMEPEHWRGYTCDVIGRLFPMFPLSLEGLGQAIDHLVRKTAPPPPPALDPRLVRD